MGFMLMFLQIIRVQYVFPLKELNLRQKKWLELLKDYDMSVLYYPGKANVVAHSLSRMTMGSVYHLDEANKDLAREVHTLARLGMRLESSPDGGAIVYHNSESSLQVEVKFKQHLDFALMELKESVLDKFNESFFLMGMVC